MVPLPHGLKGISGSGVSPLRGCWTSSRQTQCNRVESTTYISLSKKSSKPNSLFPAPKVQKAPLASPQGLCLCLCFSSARTLDVGTENKPRKFTFFINFPILASSLLSNNKMGSSSGLSSCVHISRPFHIKDLSVCPRGTKWVFLLFFFC